MEKNDISKILNLKSVVSFRTAKNIKVKLQLCDSLKCSHPVNIFSKEFSTNTIKCKHFSRESLRKLAFT